MPKGLMVHTTGSSVAGAGQVHKFLNDGSAVFGSGSAAAGIDNKSITMFDATNGAGSVTVYGNLSASVNLSASGFYGDGSNLSGVTAGSIAADDIANGDAATTIRTTSGAITIKADSGAVDIDADSGALSLDGSGGINIGTESDVAIDVDASTFDLDASGAVTIDGAGIALAGGANASSFNEATGGADAKDLTISVTGGGDSSLLLSSAGTGADALSLDVSAGSMVVAPSLADGQTLKLGKNGAVEMVFTPHGTAGNEKWSLTNTAGTAADAIAIDASAGGISIDAAAASNFSTSAGALTLDGNGGVNIVGNAAEIDITTSAALDLNSGAGTWNASTLGLTSTGTMTVTSVAYDHNASGAVTIDTSDTTNGVKIGASTSGMPITLGHTTSEVTVADNLTVAGDLTVQGTTTTVNVEVVQSANGVIFEGASADDYETTLKAEDPTADHTYHLPDLGSTNDEGYVMAFEANPGTSPLITATPAEVNLLDGGTSAGTTAVAGSDGIVTNDGGTMRQTTVDTFDTYLAATTKTLTNKTIDADNNTLSNIEVDNFKASAIVTQAEGIGSNNVDTMIPTSKAVKHYVDNNATGISPADDTSDTTAFLVFANEATDALQTPKTNTKLTLNAANNPHLMLSGTLFAHTASVTDLNATKISGSSSTNMEISSDQDLVFVIDANNSGTQNYTFKDGTSSIAEMDDAGSLQLSGGLSASLGISGSELYLKGVEVTATAAELNYLDIASLGTAAASKALVADGSANINASAITFTNLGTVTTADINGGTIDGATIATSDVTVGAGKTLNVSAGTLTTSAAQNLAIMQGAANNVDIGAYELRAQTLQSDVTTGTAPLTVASTTLVANLNADKLDGQEGSYYTDFSNMTVDNDEISGDKIQGGTIGSTTITALTTAGITATADIDIGAYDLRAATVTADGLTAGQVVYAGTNGVLSAEAGFEYDASSNTLTVANLTVSGDTTTVSTTNMFVED